MVELNLGFDLNWYLMELGFESELRSEVWVLVIDCSDIDKEEDMMLGDRYLVKTELRQRQESMVNN